MSKTIHVFIRHVDFDANAKHLGSEYVFDFTILERTSSVPAKVVNQAPVIVPQRIMALEVASTPITLPIKITAREIDLVDDVGVTETEYNLDFSETGANLLVIDVRVEARGRESVRFGIITIQLEFTLDQGIRYVPDLDPEGWLDVVPERGRIIQLPNYLKVEVTHVADGREYFIIKEGLYEDKRASVALRSNSDSFLDRSLAHSGPVSLTFSIASKKLTVENLGDFFAETLSSDPVPLGIHTLEIADVPHSGGSLYVSRSKHARTWFRIGVVNARYLHTGRISAGCITMGEIDSWEEIYELLIKARRDSKTIGTINVI